VYFEDDQNTVYDIEMQNDIQGDLLRRSRYYQSVIDTEQIKAGESYEKLKDSYVIFISSFDPFHVDTRYMKSDRCAGITERQRKNTMKLMSAGGAFRKAVGAAGVRR
jgi:predicted transposase/invertase (TIGR01784 family)